MRVLNNAGLRVPQDISAVGYDGINLARVMGLTTFCQDTKALGATAADRLISLIERPKTTLLDRVMIPGHLLEGTSVKKLP